MSNKKLKPLPTFATDDEAERFVDESDLTQFDLSGAKSVTLERAGRTQQAQGGVAAFHFELYKDRSGGFRFRFLAAGGDVIFSSEVFRTKADALRAVEAIRANANGADIMDGTLAA